ncbi:MAG TPA: Eco57I restriction-modification methylase domain-containing protein [Verrucomicrobiota bacterium]|nr:Eco57I restriction-modification methylase domain-containing protein [Verrucomicrobiota bacterium]
MAREIWNLLAHERVAAGSIDQLIESLPKKPVARGKARPGWLIKPDRSRALDTNFLNFLDDARRELAGDLLKHNDRADLLLDSRLNEAVQHILDRLLFLRICEDRDIDTGRPLELIVREWRKDAEPDAPRRRRQPPLELREEPPEHHGASGVRAPRGTLWHGLVRHFRALDRRPPSHIPFFNGNLFKPHFSEELVVSDDWLVRFLGEIGDEESPYLFNYIPVEILGTIYERFLGKVVRPRGRGVTIEEKPEVRKAGGVYYTPRYIVEYIVGQTVGKLLENRAPEEALSLRILDPACGSGSFLICAFEKVCEYCQQWLTDDLRRASKTPRGSGVNAAPVAKSPPPAWLKKHRDWCWVEDNAVHLTTKARRRILRATIHGVDLDPQAVEVTQLSLYLKMLEGENRVTLARERDLFGSDEALLPALEHNIKCGNSLIASDFSMMPEDLVRVHAFDWPVQFPAIMKAGGFDAVIGNPPYIRIQTMQQTDPESVEYLNSHYATAAKGNYDIYAVFIERAVSLLNKNGRHGYIVPHKFFNSQYGEALRKHLAAGKHVCGITHFGHQQIFDGATTYTCLLFTQKSPAASFRFARVDDLKEWEKAKTETVGIVPAEKLSDDDWIFAAGPVAGLLEKLRQQPATLETVTDRIFQGLKTSADKIYIVEERRRKGKQVLVWSPEKQAEYWLETGLLHPLIKGGDSRRYAMTKTERLILFPYRQADDGSVELISQAELKKQYPRTWDYFCDNKSYLDNREDGRFRGSGWYQFGRSQALDVMPLPKLFTPDLAACASFSFDETGECFFTGGVAGGYGLLAKPGVSPKFLLSLLNSRLLNWVIAQTGTVMRGGYFSFEARFIRSLPIPQPDFTKPADRARHDRLVGLADKMLALVPKLRAATPGAERATLQNAVTATDQQIDALVYDLYGLTAEEIKLVEGAA